ncbi:hypothetical protein JTE90_002364 [Oedothorax gibbosus]|uniref:Uncharacterized protein n=1 Tax=Oedothorax gibbosus TaxID=931172 RepID=A0AAV6VBW8_9ARAC|nr:hypothetical protein JTE90_002364 [Oedothorax gibbosus]
MDHPTSKGLTWERRVRKKKHISKFTDKDLIEWRVSQNFRLKALEEWALSRSEARKLAEESPYDFDDLLDDDESRQLEDMFNILDTQKQSKKEVGALEKELHTKRPFKLKDERKEDWTESYSDDSEQSGDEAEDRFCEILEIEEEPDLEIEDLNYKEAIGEQTRRDQEEFIPTHIFSPYKEIPKYRRPIFEIMEKIEDMTEWYDHCHEAIGEGREFKIEHHPPTIMIASPENEIEPFNLEPEAKRSVEKVIKTSIENIRGENHEKSAHDDEDEDHETSMHDEKGHERPAQGEKDSESLAHDDHKKPIHDKEDLSSESQVSKNATEPDSEDFMGKHGASEIGSNIKSIISKARNSVFDIVPEKFSEEDTTKDPGKPAEDLESVLRIESMSKGRINVRGRKSSSQKDMLEGKVKSMIFMAKNSYSDKLNESLKNKEKKSAVKDGTQTIISEAKSSAENLARVVSPESVSTDSLEYVLRQESVSKTKIDKTNAK